jgi:hypothetical protein
MQSHYFSIFLPAYFIPANPPKALPREKGGNLWIKNLRFMLR